MISSEIKKVWKGHYVRKNVYDYYAMKTYLGALEEKNKIVRSVVSVINYEDIQPHPERVWDGGRVVGAIN